jgi:hypothetical protein
LCTSLADTAKALVAFGKTRSKAFNMKDMKKTWFFSFWNPCEMRAGAGGWFDEGHGGDQIHVTAGSS